MNLNRVLWGFILLLIIVFAVYPVSAQVSEFSGYYNVDNRRELFVDDFLIESMESVNIKLHEPIARETVLLFDQPWEGPFAGQVTVLKEDSLFRMYYRGAIKGGENTTCYAESLNGENWVKPKLGLYEIKGSMENNVIWMDNGNISHNFSPFIDYNKPASSDERYKAVGGKKEHGGLYAMVSDDGIRWKKKWKNPIITDGVFDSQNVAFWSDAEQKYVCYFRTWDKTEEDVFRSVSRSTSNDFHSWTTTREMEYGSTKREHIYTNQTHPYYRAPHIYISLAARFIPDCRAISQEEIDSLNVASGYVNDCSDVVLMSSRGGDQYTRLFMESFIRPGIGPENWVSRTNYPGLNVVQTSTSEMSLYVCQNYAQPTSHLRRYTLRIDGFTSVNAGYEGGEMVTIPLVFKGSDLYINYATSAAGSIRVELLDGNNQPIEGFALQDCKKIVGNKIKQKVLWAEEANLGKLEGQIVKLRFVMKEADLFSLKFE